MPACVGRDADVVADAFKAARRRQREACTVTAALIPRTSRAAFAHHEAGHAIVGIALGFDVVEISIVEVEREEYVLSGFVLYGQEHDLDLRGRIVRTAAGPIAQEVYSELGDLARNAAGDEESIVKLAESLPAATRAETVEDCRREARALVLQLWRDIEALAEALMQRGSVAGSDIASAIRQGRRDIDDEFKPDEPFRRAA